jgi:hypothetical protein
MEPASPPAVTQKSVASRELDELATIKSDPKALAALVSEGALESTATLETLSELSSRLLCRNRAREAFVKYGAALYGGGDKKAEETPVDAAARTLLPSYFRHTALSGDEGGTTDLYVSKVFLQGLPAAPEGTALCARFSLSARVNGAGDDEPPLHDLSLKVMQIAPFDAGTSKFSFSFVLTDVTSAAAAEFTLDDSQRQRLAVLQQMLGLKARFTPVGIFGLLLCGAGCAALDDNDCFTALVRASREAHRDELLAASGSLF